MWPMCTLPIMQHSGSVDLCTSMFSGGINQQYEIYDTDTNDLMSDKDDMLYEFNMIRCDMPSVMCIKMCQL